MQQQYTIDVSHDHLDPFKQSATFEKASFVQKKRPKAEDIDNENTHYQRAHVKNVKFSFFGKENAENSHLCFM